MPLLAKAKQAGIIPITQFNGGATGGLRLPAAEPDGLLRRPPGPINDWIFQKPGATIDTPTEPARRRSTCEQWIKAGYFAKDVNSLDYATMMSRFIGGKGLFMFDGDWESGQPRQADGRQRRLLPDAAGRRRAASRRRCRRR